jgi:hypothetical protein
MAKRFHEDLLPHMDAAQADAYMETDAMKSAIRVFRQYYVQGIEAHIADMRVLTREWGFSIGNVGHDGVKLWYGGGYVNTPPQMGLYLARHLPGSIYHEYAGETHSSLLGGPHLKKMLADLIDAK